MNFVKDIRRAKNIGDMSFASLKRWVTRPASDGRQVQRGVVFLQSRLFRDIIKVLNLRYRHILA